VDDMDGQERELFCRRRSAENGTDFLVNPDS